MVVEVTQFVIPAGQQRPAGCACLWDRQTMLYRTNEKHNPQSYSRHIQHASIRLGVDVDIFLAYFNEPALLVEGDDSRTAGCRVSCWRTTLLCSVQVVLTDHPCFTPYISAQNPRFKTQRIRVYVVAGCWHSTQLTESAASCVVDVIARFMKIETVLAVVCSSLSIHCPDLLAGSTETSSCMAAAGSVLLFPDGSVD